MPQSTIRQTHT